MQKAVFLMMQLILSNNVNTPIQYTVIFSSPEPKAHRTGELIVYSCSGGRPSFTMLKHLLRNRLANQSQIFCQAFMGRRNESLLMASGSHDLDGRHTHIWLKPFKNPLLQNQMSYDPETWHVVSRTRACHSLLK